MTASHTEQVFKVHFQDHQNPSAFYGCCLSICLVYTFGDMRCEAARNSESSLSLPAVQGAPTLSGAQVIRLRNRRRPLPLALQTST